MLRAGLDLSRRGVGVCLISGAGEVVDEWASPPDADGLRGLVARAAMRGPGVRGVIESMNGARFVHDRLEGHGWDVVIADARRVRGPAPLACKTDKIDARVHGCRRATSCPGSGCPIRRSPRARAGALSAAPGRSPRDAEEPHPRHADRLRPPPPGQ
jgi:hypothetical protein